MFKLDLETAEAAEIKLPTSSGYQRSKRVPENHLLLLYLLHQNLWLCASQQTVEHSSRDRNTRPPYLSPEKYVCRSWSNRHETTDWFQIGKGVSQSCILSSFLFNLNAEYIMWNARLDEAQTGIKIVWRSINNLRYADDTTLIAESKEELKSLLMKVNEEGEKVGSKLNIQKTKIMASSPITSWQIDGATVETVIDIVFLGSKITAEMVTSVMILKGTWFLEEKLWPT